MKPSPAETHKSLTEQAIKAREARRWKRMNELCQQNSKIMLAQLRRENRQSRKAA
jgi:hypothetical protein